MELYLKKRPDELFDIGLHSFIKISKFRFIIIHILIILTSMNNLRYNQSIIDSHVAVHTDLIMSSALKHSR